VHAEQRLQPMRSNDVPASLFGEERHCFGAGGDQLYIRGWDYNII
jgi:hypothetical protein